MTEASGALGLPPLLTDVAVTADVDPFDAAQQAARDGIDAGTVFWALRDDRAEAAFVVAPEQPLRQALTVLFAMEQALTDAIGALGPAEIAAIWAWPDVFLLNGARAGRLRVASSHQNIDDTPDWIVFAMSLRLEPRNAADSGERPDETSLAEEGLGDLSASDIVGAWARHALYWITRWEEDGLSAVMREWRGRAEGVDGEVSISIGPEAPLAGDWLGLDDEGGLTVKGADGPVHLDLLRVLTAEFIAGAQDPLDRPAALTSLSGSVPIGGQALRRS